MVIIKELAEPLVTKVLQNRLNHTCNGLLGQLIAIVVIPPAPPQQPQLIATATATIPPRTQIPTPTVP